MLAAGLSSACAGAAAPAPLPWVLNVIVPTWLALYPACAPGIPRGEGPTPSPGALWEAGLASNVGCVVSTHRSDSRMVAGR